MLSTSLIQLEYASKQWKSTFSYFADRRCSLWGWRKGVPGGLPSTIVRGVCGQALSLPRLPAHGACLGSATHVLWARACGCGGQTLSPWLACPVGAACRGGGGVSEVRRCPSPDCQPTGRAVGVRHPPAVGAGVWVWGPNTVPLASMPRGGCVPRGWWGAVPGGGGLPPL